MNDTQPAAPSASAPSSFFTRLTNIYTSPSQLFTEVAAASPQTTSWLIPYIISLLLAVLVTFTLFNNPSMRQQVIDTRERAMKQMVADGKMTQDVYDKQSSGMENAGAGLFVGFGALFATIAISAFVFLGSLLLWLATRISLHYSGPYMKILEIFGLSMLIGVLGTIVAIITMNLMNSMFATPSGAMFVLDSFDPTNKGHKLLSSLNVFTLWQVVVLGIGIAKASGKPSGPGIGLVAALWALWVGLSTAIGLGM
jgi:hypothetical protein